MIQNDGKIDAKALCIEDVLVVKEDGNVMQKNEGGWEFVIKDDPNGKNILLDVAVGKYLDTSLINIDVQPKYVSLTIKGNVVSCQKY